MPRKYVFKHTIVQADLIKKAKEVNLRCKKARDMVKSYTKGNGSWKWCQVAINRREKAKEEMFEIIAKL